MKTIKPVFKWAGGKMRMRKKYEKHFDLSGCDTFVDAFFGSGAMSIWARELSPGINVVAIENNSEMMSMYNDLASHTDQFIEIFNKLGEKYIAITEDSGRYYFYYLQRERYDWNETIQPVERSALLLFLMKLCFNGVWQAGNFAGGRFSTAVGSRNQTSWNHTENLREFAGFLRSIKLVCGDFGLAKDLAGPTSFLYCDPPYRGSQTPYTRAFTDSEQVRLTELMRYASDLGGRVAMSNSDTGDGFWEQHLPGWIIEGFDVKYTVTRSSEVPLNREVLIQNYSAAVKEDVQRDLFAEEATT